MAYTTANLSLQVVQRLLREKSVEMDHLVERRDKLILDQSSTTRVELENELAETISALDAITIQIAAMADGPAKKKAQLEQSRLKTNQIRLEIRLSHNEAESVPEREYDLEIVQFKISRLEIYIADLQAREAELDS